MDRRTTYAAARSLDSERPLVNGEAIDPVRPFPDDCRGRSFSDGDVDELFHEATKVTARYERRRRATDAALGATDVRTVQASRNPERETAPLVGLPEPAIDDAALASQPRSPDRPLTGAALASLLAAAVGERDGDRPYPSAGGLYPVEVYAAARDGDPAEGTCYYGPASGDLRRLGGDPEAVYAGAGDPSADLLLCLAGVFPRVKARYGSRGYRYALLEAGAAARSVMAAGASLGLRVEPRFEYRDTALDAAFGLNGVDESVLLVLEVTGA